MFRTWHSELERLERRYPPLASCLADLTAAVELICESLANKQLLMVCGNGGSAADAEHIVGELLKKFCQPRPVPADIQAALRSDFAAEGAYLADHLESGLRAIALTGHPALTTAMANDVAGDLAFAQQVLAFGQPGDVLLGISTSGNSRSVCHALRVARVLKIRTIGLTGAGHGDMVELCDIAIEAPSRSTADIQEYHLPLYHALCRMVEDFYYAPDVDSEI